MVLRYRSERNVVSPFSLTNRLSSYPADESIKKVTLAPAKVTFNELWFHYGAATVSLAKSPNSAILAAGTTARMVPVASLYSQSWELSAARSVPLVKPFWVTCCR